MQITPKETIKMLQKSKVIFDSLLRLNAKSEAIHGIGKATQEIITYHIIELRDYIYTMEHFEASQAAMRSGNLLKNDWQTQADGIK